MITMMFGFSAACNEAKTGSRVKRRRKIEEMGFMDIGTTMRKNTMHGNGILARRCGDEWFSLMLFNRGLVDFAQHRLHSCEVELREIFETNATFPAIDFADAIAMLF